MALKIIHGPENAPLEPLAGRTVAVLGFGNQGSAHALNLRDSGVKTVVGARPGSSGAERARSRGFEVHPIEVAVAAADLLIMALPDEVHGAVWRDGIEPNLRPGTTVGVLHGFSVRFGAVAPRPEIEVVMVAPKGPGPTLRRRYEEGRGIPCLFAVAREGAVSPPGRAEARGLAWANGIGCARAAIVYTTFADETETDLFGEQAVLCGGMNALIIAAFETLVAAGYPPELAYMECCQEVKQVADLVYERGLAGMMSAISNTAEFGAHAAGGRLVDESFRDRIREVLEEVRDGRFARAFTEDHERGFPWFEGQRRGLREHAIEPAGRAVRAWMGGTGEPEREGAS